jgi:hypothetical protein
MIRDGASLEEARSKIWMYDVHGLIVQVSFIHKKIISTNPNCLN